MKRLIKLLLVAGLVFGNTVSAGAVDFKTSGEWDFNFEWSETSFQKGDSADEFTPRQRLRTQVDVIASESLKGVVQLEIGDTTWGNASEGGALGTDAKNVEVRYSYIDWVFPQTELQVRMGLQPFALPGLVAGSPVLDDDGAGITLSYAFNEQFAASLFWLRPFNNNNEHNAWHGSRDIKDTMDLVGLSLPVTGNGWQVNPWGMVGVMGRDSVYNHYTDAQGVRVSEPVGATLLPVGAEQAAHDGSTTAYWTGLTAELTLFDPFRVALDGVYGNVDWGNALGTVNGHHFDLSRSGWMVSALAEYKFSGVTPGLMAWYASGDNSNPYDGSERLPSIAPSWKASTFGYDDAYGIGTGAVLSLSPAGTWGVLARLADISFVEDLTHTFRVGYYRGTNDTQMVKRGFVTEVASENVYLTDKDSVWEVNFDSQYKLYENLTLVAELGYLKLDLNEGVWGATKHGVQDNAYKAGVSLNYAF